MHLPVLSNSKNKENQFENYPIADFLNSDSFFNESHDKRFRVATERFPYL